MKILHTLQTFWSFFAATRETYYSHSLVKLARNSDYSLVKLAKVVIIPS